MKNLFDKFKEMGKKTLLLGSLLATATIGLNGCQTINVGNKIYEGASIHKVEETRKDERIKYYISSIYKNHDKIGLKVNELAVETKDILEYDEIPIIREDYKIVKKAGVDDVLITAALYSLINASVLLIPFFYDVVKVSSGEYQKTYFYDTLFYYIPGITTDRSKTVIKTDIRNKKDRTNKYYNKVKENSNIPVVVYTENPVLQGNVNELTKNTDEKGMVVFQINEKPGRIKIETLAQDGENDKVELK